MRRPQILRRLASVLCLLMATPPLIAPPAASAAPSLELVDSFGGPGHADMYPSGLEFAPNGDLVVADAGNNRAKRYSVNENGSFSLLWETQTTFGSGVNQLDNPRDVGIDANGDVYLGDTVNGRVVKFDGQNGAWITSWKGTGTNRIGSTMGITVGGNPERVIVADALRKKVRVFTLTGDHVRSFGSAGACSFSPIRDVDVDSDGNFYVANYTSNNILKMSPSGTCLSMWGTKGAGAGQFKNPYGLSIGRDPLLDGGIDVVFVADSNNNRIQEFRLDGTFVSTFGASGDYNQAGTFSTLRRVAVNDEGDVCGADLWGWRVSCFTRQTTGYTYNSTNPDPIAIPPGYPERPFTAAQAFNEPRGLAFDAAGNTYVADVVNQRIVRLDPSGLAIEVCGERGEEPTSLNWPRGVAVDSGTGNVWVADTKQSRVQIIGRPFSACIRSRIGTVGTGESNFNWPASVAIRDSDKTAWFADWKNNRVSVWSVATRKPLATYGAQGSGVGQFAEPRGIGVAPDGSIIVADTKNNRVVKLSATSAGSGSPVITWDKEFDAGSSLEAPEGVDADAAGRIYIADTGDSEVVALDQNGAVLSTLTGFNSPANVAVNDFTNRVVVADTYNDRVQVYGWL